MTSSSMDTMLRDASLMLGTREQRRWEM